MAAMAIAPTGKPEPSGSPQPEFPVTLVVIDRQPKLLLPHLRPQNRWTDHPAFGNYASSGQARFAVLFGVKRFIRLYYTYSHAFDDIGVGQQYIAITPTDQFSPKKDYEPSYFDRRHVVTGFFVYDLPFGKGRRWNTSNFLDKLFGGWEVSSVITASSGTPMYVYNFNSCAEGGAGYYANCGTLIPISGKSYNVSAHYMPDGSVQAFSDIAGVKKDFREPFFSDKRYGGAVIRDFNRWNVDASLTKKTKITERVDFGLTLQAVNVFNHMEFSGSTQNLSSSSFGKVSSQYNSPRFLSIGARIDF